MSGEDSFCSSCPLLRGNNITKSAEIGFYRGCKVEDHCLADIAIEISFLDNVGYVCINTKCTYLHNLFSDKNWEIL
jgi:hypothetical protein